MRKVLMRDGEFILTVNSLGNHLMYHQHTDDPYRGARLVAGVCVVCLVAPPEAMTGMMELCKWER